MNTHLPTGAVVARIDGSRGCGVAIGWAVGPGESSSAAVDLYWLPLGAGDAPRIVRWSGRAFEALVAGRERRDRCALYHSALEVSLAGNGS